MKKNQIKKRIVLKCRNFMRYNHTLGENLKCVLYTVFNVKQHQSKDSNITFKLNCEKCA